MRWTRSFLSFRLFWWWMMAWNDVCLHRNNGLPTGNETSAESKKLIHRFYVKRTEKRIINHNEASYCLVLPPQRSLSWSLAKNGLKSWTPYLGNETSAESIKLSSFYVKKNRETHYKPQRSLVLPHTANPRVSIRISCRKWFEVRDFPTWKSFISRFQVWRPRN
jgi:hypothetical protein